MDAENGRGKRGDGCSGPVTGSATMGPVGSSGSGGSRSVVRTGPIRSSDRLRKKAYPAQVHVFNIAELREKIVELAIFDLFGKKDEKLDRTTACSLRLVGKAWNGTIVGILHKKRRPLFQLSAYGHKKNLERFCSTFSSSTYSDSRIPPFHLEICCLEPKMIRDQPLSNLFTQCGAGLVELKIVTNFTGRPCRVQFPKWPLDHLCKLEISVLTNQCRAVRDEKTVGLPIINSILKGATTVSELKVVANFALPEVSIFGLITVPATVTNFSVKADIRSRDLQILSRNPLPNLTALDLSVKYDSLVDGSFVRIMEIYRASLKKLTIESCSPPPANTILIRFPVMDKLEELSIDLLKYDLEDSSMHPLVRSFPKVYTLHLINLTEETLRKWTGYSKFMSVTSLQFHFAEPVQEIRFGLNGGRPVILSYSIASLKRETMQVFKFAFPNLRKLEVDFSGMETRGLEYVFREMTQLTHLKLNYERSVPEVSSHFWDAVLTGLPIQTVTQCRRDPNYLERIGVENQRLESIKNLHELRSISLMDVLTTSLRIQRGIDNLAPFISNVTFRLALLQMPKLKKLLLTGRFAASDEMAEEWRNSGRFKKRRKHC